MYRPNPGYGAPFANGRGGHFAPPLFGLTPHIRIFHDQPPPLSMNGAHGQRLRSPSPPRERETRPRHSRGGGAHRHGDRRLPHESAGPIISIVPSSMLRGSAGMSVGQPPAPFLSVGPPIVSSRGPPPQLRREEMEAGELDEYEGGASSRPRSPPHSSSTRHRRQSRSPSPRYHSRDRDYHDSHRRSRSRGRERDDYFDEYYYRDSHGHSSRLRSHRSNQRDDYYYYDDDDERIENERERSPPRASQHYHGRSAQRGERNSRDGDRYYEDYYYEESYDQFYERDRRDEQRPHFPPPPLPHGTSSHAVPKHQLRAFPPSGPPPPPPPPRSFPASRPLPPQGRGGPPHHYDSQQLPHQPTSRPVLAPSLVSQSSASKASSPSPNNEKSSSATHGLPTHSWSNEKLLAPTSFLAIDKELRVSNRVDRFTRAAMQAEWDTRQSLLSLHDRRRALDALSVDRLLASIERQRGDEEVKVWESEIAAVNQQPPSSVNNSTDGSGASSSSGSQQQAAGR